MTAEVNALVCKSLTEDLSGLSFEKIKINDLTSNDLLIKVKAASVNFPDLLMSKGVPQEVIVESKAKMRAINSAWDQVQKLKSN